MSKPSICVRVGRFRRRVREAFMPSVASLAVGLALGAASSPTEAATEASVRQYPQCAQEDSAQCVWLNSGPGFSFVSGAPRDPAPRVFRVSDRLAHQLADRHGTWQRAPRGQSWDLVHPTRDGRATVTTGRDAVISYIGGTTFVITREGLVASS